jgi:hypothetical protein
MRLLLGTGEMEAVRTGMARVSAVIKVGHIPKSLSGNSYGVWLA